MSDQASDIKGTLAGIATAQYDGDYSAHVLEQWKLYVTMADQISGRRERTNAFFATLHTGSIAAIGFLIEKQFAAWILAISLLGGVPLSYLWYCAIRSYRDINTAKFKVVHEIEAHLPLRPYHAEWEAVGRGANKQRYMPFTHIEVHIPKVFLVAYALIALAAVVSLG